MKRALWLWSGVVLLAAVTAAGRAQATTAQPGPTHPFLTVNACYRFVFPIAGAPQWKVLEILDEGWIRAEVDAGSRAAAREVVWVNTAQLVTVRPAPCGGA
jgi:hypothetical protein